MQIQERGIGSVAILSISGDVVLNGSGRKLAATVRRLLGQNYRHIVLDLGRVRYVDSSGLGELVEAFSAVRNRNGSISLAHVSRRLSDLLIVTRLFTVFDYFDDEQEAVEDLDDLPYTH